MIFFNTFIVLIIAVINFFYNWIFILFYNIFIFHIF